MTTSGHRQSAAEAADQHYVELGGRVGSLEGHMTALAQTQVELSANMNRGFSKLERSIEALAERQQQAQKFPVVAAAGLLLSGVSVVGVGVAALNSIQSDKILRVEAAAAELKMDQRQAEQEHILELRLRGEWMGRIEAVQDRLSTDVTGISHTIEVVPVLSERMEGMMYRIQSLDGNFKESSESIKGILKTRFSREDWERERKFLHDRESLTSKDADSR